MNNVVDAPPERNVIELPWWVFPLAALPALVIVLGLAIPEALWLRALAIVPSLLLIWVTIRVSLRVVSASMQSVWISLAFGLWAIFPVAWIVGLVSRT